MRSVLRAVLLGALLRSGVCAQEAPALDAPPPRPASVLRQQAIEVFRRGLYEEAAKLYEAEASTAPADEGAARDSMWAYWYSGQYSRTAQAGHRVLKLAKDDLEALNLAARSHLFAGERRSALKDYLRSIDLDAAQTPPRYAAGRLYEWFRHYRTAIHYAEWTLEDMPQDAGLYALIGRSRFYLEQYAASARAWNAAVARRPQSPDFRLSEAQALYFAGKTDRALALARALNAERPRYWPAVDFLVAVAVLDRDLPRAGALLETALASFEPRDEPRLLYLADLYLAQDKPDRFLAALERLLLRNPDHSGALMAKASYLTKRGQGARAAELYRRAAALNPGSGEAWLGLGAALAVSSRTAEAVAAVVQARRLDPTDPQLLLLHARYRYQDGDRRGSKRMLLDWLRENEGEVLPVLLYHGLTRFSRDPMLAYSIHMTSAVFSDHIATLADEGFVPVTAEQAAAWFRGRMELPRSSVLVTFDDARLDSIRLADPILRRYGFRAAMYVPLHVLKLNHHPFATWAQLKAMRHSRRWDIQAHGDLGRTFIETDEDLRGGLFLPNRKWLGARGRVETPAEWLARAGRDYDLAKWDLEAKVGRLPSTFSFPQGDYGQLGAPNLPGSRDLNLNLCRGAFTVCFHQDGTGLNVRSRDPALATRLEATSRHTGADLVKLIGDQDPRVRVRRALVMRAIDDRRPREALSWLDKNKASDASQPLLLSDEARIRFAFGDQARGLGLARRALHEDEGPEYRGLVDNLERRMRPGWTPNASYFRDNRQRRAFRLEQALGVWPVGYNLVKPLYGYGFYEQEGAPAVTGHSVGVESSRHLSLFHVLTLRGLGHAFSSQAGRQRRYTFAAALRSRWKDPLFTEFEAGVLPYLTVRGITRGVTERYASAAAGEYTPDSWQAAARLRASSQSDDNARLAVTGRLSHPFSPNLLGLRAIYQLSFDVSRRQSDAYYSPRRLVMAQLGASWEHEFSPSVKADAVYLPGYGRELPQVTRFVHRLDAGLTAAAGEKFLLRPYYSLTVAPLYRGETYGALFTYRF